MPDLTNTVDYLDNTSYGAVDLRQPHGLGPGVRLYSDWLLSLPGGLNVQMAGGQAAVKCVGLTDGGYYRIAETANYTVAIPANAGSNARLDQIVLRVYDSTIDPAAGARIGRIECVTGDNSVAGADLDNRSNAKDLTTLSPAGSRSVELLYDVLTPGGGPTSIPANNVRDRRRYGGNGVPGLFTKVPMVTFRPSPGVGTSAARTIANSMSGMQSAALMYLDEPIKQATRIRSRWMHGATAVAACNYNIAICDASGRLKVATGSTAFGNPVAVHQYVASQAFSGGGAMDFDRGAYYVWFGLGTGIAAGQTLTYEGVASDDTSMTSGPNMFLYKDTGSAIFPAAGTILSMLDTAVQGGANAAGVHVGVPIVTLSVG